MVDVMCRDMSPNGSRADAGDPGAAALPEVVSAAIVVDPDGGPDGGWPGGLDAWLLAAARRGARIRVLVVGEPPYPWLVRVGVELAAAGVEVRGTSPAAPPLLVVDGTTAVVPQEPGEPATVHQPAVVRALSGAAEALWDGGVPLVPMSREAALAPHGQVQRRIVQLLAGGAKDETVARVLGISVRTCRRHIAEILARLGAVSRFQAGANAARLGMLAGSERMPLGRHPATD